MKKIIITFMAAAVCILAFGQAKKPTMMVVPSNTWCSDHGFMKEFTTNGGTKTVPNYERALMEDGDLKVAITVINEMMSAAGFDMEDMETYLGGLDVTNAEEIVATSKTGADVSSTPLDELNKRAKADIIFDLYWKVNKMGPYKSITYNLRALDAYSKKQIAAESGTGPEVSSTPLAAMIHDAVIGTQESFKGKLMRHFQDMQAKGREVALEIRLWDDCGFDLEEEYGGQELNQVIEDWLYNNTVNGVYSVRDATETRMNIEQVRIPLYDERGRAQDATRWARGLANHLKSLGIVTKVNARGLGRATLTLGGK